MAKETYIVQKGDTLSKIAAEYNTTVDKLVELNKIPDPDYIVVGQVLIISGGTATVKTNKTKKAVIRIFGLQSDTTSTMYATWTWDKKNTKHYEVIWYYDTGDDVWFIGSESTVEVKQSVYAAPNNAKRVKFKVRPISNTRTVKKKETVYWTAAWSNEKTYDFINNPPTTPPVPTVTMDDYKLTAKLENLDVNATSIEFKVVRNDTVTHSQGTVPINTTTNSAIYTCAVTAGSEYKVACRACRGTVYSDWSEFSSASKSAPKTPSGFKSCYGKTETSVYLEWDAVTSAESYTIEYTTKKEYFDGSSEVSSQSGITVTYFEVTGLERGSAYFFRLKAVNAAGESGWSKISSVVLGEPPSAPTTWSSTTTCMVGEELTLNWVHNSEDGSTQKQAEIEITIDGVIETHTVDSSSEDDDEKTMFFKIDTSEYTEGTKLEWRVRTMGVTNTYGEWSIQRVVDIYAVPTLAMAITDLEGAAVDLLEAFPFTVTCIAGPTTQTPISYHLTIYPTQAYESVDDIGNVKMVNVNELVYSKFFDVSETLSVSISAGDVNLENNIVYNVECTVSMDSGLTATAYSTIQPYWDDDLYEPNAEIGADSETLTTIVRPYCDDENGLLIEGITLSVYRREFDGRFTELIRGLPNDGETFITDPHPALDYARYRIVAVTDATGAISYTDLPGYPIGEPGIIIQWDEEWTNFNNFNEDAGEEPNWAGSMLRLLYNVDIADDHKPDVSLVEYIGRTDPVSYYGTQLGHTSTWNTVIPKSDKETLYALRRLARWPGDVYVREPSGSGYWAHITVSFSQKHREVTIPITLNVTRVSGGI